MGRRVSPAVLAAKFSKGISQLWLSVVQVQKNNGRQCYLPPVSIGFQLDQAVLLVFRCDAHFRAIGVFRSLGSLECTGLKFAEH